MGMVEVVRPPKVGFVQPSEVPGNSWGGRGRKHGNSRRRVEAFAAWEPPLRSGPKQPGPVSPPRRLAISSEPAWRLRPQTGPIPLTRTARSPSRASGHTEAFGVEL